MLREANNKVKIEGILSEINIEDGSYKKDGQDVECIRGDIKVRTAQRINDKDVELEIPVYVFARKYVTNKNGETVVSVPYKSIKKVQEEFISIAASDIETADRVRITSARIGENAYYNQNGQIVSFPHINATFINKIRKEDCKPQAIFEVEAYINSCNYEIDKEGEETGRYEITGVIPLYGGRTDVVKFYSNNPNVTDVISQSWENGNTVLIGGKLNFSSKIETVKKSLGFGEAVEESRTINVSELVITGGNPDPLEDEYAFDREEIGKALNDRMARLEAQKAKSMSKTRSKNAPAPTEKASFDNLGF